MLPNTARQRTRATLTLSVLPVVTSVYEMKLSEVSGVILYISWGCTARNVNQVPDVPLRWDFTGDLKLTQHSPKKQTARFPSIALVLSHCSSGPFLISVLKKESIFQSKTLSSTLRLNRPRSINRSTNCRLCFLSKFGGIRVGGKKYISIPHLVLEMIEENRNDKNPR